MTSVSLDQYPQAVDMTRRDGYGRYLIVPPQGGQPVGYTRVTTVANTLDDTGGLAPWKATMAATGLIIRRGLRSRMEALMAATGGDPWYASQVSKTESKRLIEEAAAVGGANDRKEIGSSLHTITALVDLGRQPEHLTPETEADVEAYIKGRAEAGVGIVEGSIEMTVVLDRFQVAGTTDRLVTVPGYQLPLVADLKTGADLSYSWQEIAVQLAAYAHGEAVYRQGPNADGTADRRLPMPAVDQTVGLIFWLNAGTGALELWLVDLEAGWEAFEKSMWVRGWRNRRVAHKLTTPPVEDISPAVRTAEDMSPADDLVPALQASINQVDVKARREWIQTRIDIIGAHPQARADLPGSWPPGIPFLRASNDHTPSQLDLIEIALDVVETRWEIPFATTKPGRIMNLFKDSSPNKPNQTKENPT